MKRVVSLVFILSMVFTSYAQPTEFTIEALQDVFIDLEGNEVTFAAILKKHTGKTIVIDIWASWCGDCRRGMPKLKELQANNTEVQFVFLSLDRSQNRWKKGIDRFGINKDDHYYIQAGWKESAFCTSIDLDHIPRYMVVDGEGRIALFKAIVANDNKIINKLKTIQ